MFENIIKRIVDCPSIIIVGHIRPDGDCYGCQVALKEAIKDAFPNKEVYIVGQGLPFLFNELLPMDDVDENIVKKSLIVIVDLHELHRTDNELVQKYGNDFVALDHHIKCCDIPYEYYIDPDASSACEIVSRLILEANWPINPKCASALYLGIVTDTARFQYLDNFANVHRLSAMLCEKGAKPKIIQRLLALSPESKLITQGYILTHYQKRDGVIYVHLTQDELKKINANVSVGSLVVNLIGNIYDYPIWCTFVDNEVGSLVVEARSNKFNVCSVMSKYGGGGHRLAAGVTIKNATSQDMENLINDLCDLIKGMY